MLTYIMGNRVSAFIEPFFAAYDVKCTRANKTGGKGHLDRVF